MAAEAASNDGKKKLLNLEELDPSVRGCVDDLLEIQRQHDELDAKFREEKAALLAQHRNLCEPLYSQRYQIVHYEGVPNFWLEAMNNNAVLSEEITDLDEAVLISLKEIKCNRLSEHDEGFKLEFFFYTNPYFSNSVLTKTYHLTHEHDKYDGPVIKSATGSEIEWYPGKCLTWKTRVVRRNGKEPVTKTEDCESFFNFFKTLEIPKDNVEEESNDDEDDDADKLHEKLERDYDMAATIRDKIVPHAVSWFIREAAVRASDDWPEDSDDVAEEDASEDEEEEEEEEFLEEEEEEDDADEVVEDMKESAEEGSKFQQCERPPECTQQ